MSVLSPDEIKQRIQARQVDEAQAVVADIVARTRYIKPLALAAEGLIETTQNAERRWMFGLPEIDMMVRGVGKGELCYVTGRSHSGKTQVILNGLLHAPEARVLWFTPDEVAELILSKLVALRHGIDAEEIERRIKINDETIVSLVRSTATKDFPNLVVVDDSLSLGQMAEALQEYRQTYGEPSVVVVDFLELVPGDGEGTEGVTAKSQGLKRWTTDANVPCVCLHQSSRTHGVRGQSSGMDSMRYGGETEAVYVLEVFRKREDKGLDEWERASHENTVTVAVHKNKRPPCKKGQHDYYMDPATGVVRRLTSTDAGGGSLTIEQAIEERERVTSAARDTQLRMLGERDEQF